MSNDRKATPGSQHNSSSSAPAPAPSPARRLVKLLRQRESAQSDEKFDDADAQLVELIEDCLLSGDNQTLFEAVERAGRQGGQALSRALAESIEDSTASRIIQFDRRTRRGMRSEVADLSLHVMPVVMVSEHGLSPAKRFLPKDARLTAIEDSFKTHGLAPKSAHIRVAPYLYHWDELNSLSYSEIHELGLSLMNEKEDDQECARKGWPVLPVIRQGKYIELRFLVVTTVTPMSDPHVPFIARFDQAPEDEAFEMFDRRRETWARETAPLIGEWLSPTKHAGENTPHAINTGERAPHSISLTTPFSFFDGLRAGWSFHADASLALGAEIALNANYLFPRECSAHIALHGDDNDVHLRLTLTHQQKLLEGLMRPIAPFEDREAILQNLAGNLRAKGLGAVSVQGGVQPAFHCEGCKAPLFSTPWGEMLHPGEEEDGDEDGEEGYEDEEDVDDYEGDHEEGEDAFDEASNEFSGAVTEQKDPAMLKVANVLQGKTLH